MKMKFFQPNLLVDPAPSPPFLPGVAYFEMRRRGGDTWGNVPLGVPPPPPLTLVGGGRGGWMFNFVCSDNSPPLPRTAGLSGWGKYERYRPEIIEKQEKFIKLGMKGKASLSIWKEETEIKVETKG